MGVPIAAAVNTSVMALSFFGLSKMIQAMA
jgi:hypothetical protein